MEGEKKEGRREEERQQERERNRERERERGRHGRGCKPRRSARSLLEPRTGLTGPVCQISVHRHTDAQANTHSHTQKHMQNEQTHRCH